jgi:hypothetical protein
MRGFLTSLRIRREGRLWWSRTDSGAARMRPKAAASALAAVETNCWSPLFRTPDQILNVELKR